MNFAPPSLSPSLRVSVFLRFPISRGGISLSVVGLTLFLVRISCFEGVAMGDEFDFADTGNVIKDAEGKGFNQGLIVLLLVGGLVLIFLVGNYALYVYAQKSLPARKKKPVSKKKMKRERLKQGVSAPGE